MKDVYILGIESSCDETSAAIVKNGKEVLSSVILSQIDIHTLYGGVVPEIASRNHVFNITDVLDKCLKDANMKIQDIDAIAVTYGPGLNGSLLVGVEAAKTMSMVTAKPLIPVHHIAGHIYANNIEKDLEFPLIALVISGGHTDLIIMREHYNFERIGGTLDDAVGECYDKVARVMGVGYPGGPIIDKMAKVGTSLYKLPVPLDDDSFNFSFSGLKSAVINLVNKEHKMGNEINNNNLASSFQEVVIKSLTSKTLRAMKQYDVNNLILAGGVAANSGLRDEFSKLGEKNNFNFSYPSIVNCTDNAVMVAVAGYFLYQKGIFTDLKLNTKTSEYLH
ncbi:MAG TPA: tRNA (adenosine(37)-N6)-threonylcarbamoyltransferase complex transferase subunit TsaD [Bacilli bacterium]|nr:tRNA (adenosine(37)-N6)-threonylcarbamoyltransferase complex transferase subunit TsaD [Bacilli bacterium]